MYVANLRTDSESLLFGLFDKIYVYPEAAKDSR
jgi:hypothetical protein